MPIQTYLIVRDENWDFGDPNHPSHVESEDSSWQTMECLSFEMAAQRFGEAMALEDFESGCMLLRQENEPFYIKQPGWKDREARTFYYSARIVVDIREDTSC